MFCRDVSVYESFKLADNDSAGWIMKELQMVDVSSTHVFALISMGYARGKTRQVYAFKYVFTVYVQIRKVFIKILLAKQL